MIRETNEGFKILKGAGGYESLYIDSEKIEECIAYIKANKIYDITISKYHGYVAEDIDFLNSISDIIKGVSVLDHFDDTTVVNRLSGLERLSILENGKTTIDLENFPNLERCDIMAFSERIQGLETCQNLKHLSIVKFNLRAKDLTVFPILENLKEFYLLQTNITSLDGIENFRSLKKVDISYAGKLERIEALQRLSNSIEEVQFDKCKKIKDFGILGRLKLLEKIRLSDSGEIKTLDFINTLPSLNTITFVGTNVLDGNIKYCEGISHVGFDNKRHYTHRAEQFKR